MIHHFKDKNVFLIVDETDLNKTKFVNVLMDDISKPQKNYLIDCVPLIDSPNASKIAQIIDDVMRNMVIKRENFVLLISDAARYMVSAGLTMKTMYPRLFHITCFAHLLHNCALRIKSNFQNVDFLIASVKALVVKNKARREAFKSIGYPPEPIITRWGSWIEAAGYYSRNLHEIKNIITSFQGDIILLEDARKANHNKYIMEELVKIEANYSFIKKYIYR